MKALRRTQVAGILAIAVSSSPPLQPPARPSGALPAEHRTTASPFARLGITHAASVMGDAFLTVALAGSLFFTVEPGEARPKVLLYLVLTMVPFVLLAPVLGPVMDRSRGGRRLLIVVSAALRGVLCLLMAGNVDSLLLFPLAFGALMLQKGYSVAKSALVPALVPDEHALVRANSRLALISGIAAALAGIPAAGILALTDAAWVLRFGAIFYLFATLLALAIPRARVVSGPETDEERAELHAHSVVASGGAMAVLRATVGFTTFLLAFVLKEAGEPAWFYGAVFMASGIGNFAGVLLAPPLRRRIREEWILVGGLLLPAVLVLFSARSPSRPMYLLAAGSIALGAAAGRVAFDSILQRDAPEATRGRTFARYETRFQLVWVLGGILAVALVPITARSGLFVAALALGFGGLSYLGSIRRPEPVVPKRSEPLGIRHHLRRRLRRRSPEAERPR